MKSAARRAVIVLSVALAATVHVRAGGSAHALLEFAAVAGGPSQTVLDAAQTAYQHAIDLGVVVNPRLLTVIDYSRPSTEPRLWVLDLVSHAILQRELVAHGKGSGENVATSFSNDEGSHKSSLGLFVTGATYTGQNGYSLRLRGLDPGVNDRAYARDIVMHGAAYVSDAIARTLGRLGRSWGCPAVRPAIARTLIDEIKGGTVLFVYGTSASR
ncbi:MAG TPA: murein L,D-transpeptidase catalytic domain family protein [Vicinamibacterales bacterium]|nr:murein L,D-transpeptidase catalytic domain family protein [Vicinamibacterales bacterium]